MKNIFLTIILTQSILVYGQAPRFFYSQSITIPHATSGHTVGFRLTEKVFLYCDYKFEFVSRSKYTNEKKETFWTDVPQWYSKYSQPKPNESIYVIGSWGNVELDRGKVKETYYSKYGRIETKINIINFGLTQTLTENWFIQYGLGFFKKKEVGSIDEFRAEKFYDVHRVYDTWHVIHPPGHDYLLTSNHRVNVITDKTIKINNESSQLNINLVLNYIDPWTGWIYNLGLDSRNGVTLGFGLGF